MDTSRFRLSVVSDGWLYQYNREPEDNVWKPDQIPTYTRACVCIEAALGVTEQDIVDEYNRRCTTSPEYIRLQSYAPVLETTIGDDGLVRARLSVDGATSIIETVRAGTLGAYAGNGGGHIRVQAHDPMPDYSIADLARELIQARDGRKEKRN